MFAERLKQLRKKHGITQEQLASLIGVERSSIGKYEGKSRVIPSDDIKYRIAEFFNVTVDYLLGKTDTPFPQDQLVISDDESEILSEYRELNESGKELVRDYIKMLIAKTDFRQEESVQLAE